MDAAPTARALRALLPRNKNDEASARELVQLGHPAVAPVLYEMVQWLKTYPSPVEVLMREFFIGLGVHAVPAAKQALAGRTEALKYGIVAHVAVKWPREAIVSLAPELQMLVSGSGDYGTDLIALSLLAEHGLCDRAWLRQWAEFKLKGATERREAAERIVRSLG